MYGGILKTEHQEEAKLRRVLTKYIFGVKLDIVNTDMAMSTTGKVKQLLLF